jgi:hypothetical protein
MPDTIHSDLMKACKQPGCPICNLEQRTVDAYMQTAFRKKGNDYAVRADIRNSLGLCREHTRRMLYLGLNNTISAAVGYHDALLAVEQQLKEVNLQPKPSRRSWFARKHHKPAAKFESVVQALSPTLLCPACRMQENFTRNLLDGLTSSLQENGMQEALASSSGLCLPHLRQAFTRIEELDTCRLLLGMSIEWFEKLRRNLVEEIRQIENRKGEKDSEAESKIWQNVVSAIAGEL